MMVHQVIVEFSIARQKRSLKLLERINHFLHLKKGNYNHRKATTKTLN